MGVTSLFRIKPNTDVDNVSIDMSGWDYMVVQNIDNNIRSIKITNDGGAIEGSVDDSAITIPLGDANKLIETLEVLDLALGTKITSYPLTLGLYKIENIAKYINITIYEGDEIIVMLYKKG